MQQQVNNWGALAGSISAILGLLAILFFNPIKRWLKQKKERKQAEKKEEAAFREEVRSKLKSIEDKMGDFSEDIGDLQYERLSQAYDFYKEQGWCPDSKKEMLCEMKRSYTGRGRNHLTEHYEQDILSLPSKPPKG